MMVLIKNSIKKILYFNCIIITSFLLFTLFSYNNTTITNFSKKYSVQLTYYYSGDATGSGGTTGSGLKTSDFTADSNGWYHYNYNGEDYLVIAAALTKCRDSSKHCGVNVDEETGHGMASSIPYYNYYDVINLDIGGTSYKAMVLDACGACMWGDRDRMGEKFDIFTIGSSAVNPSIYSVASSGKSGSVDGNAISEFKTTYTGDLKKGYLYINQLNNIKVNDKKSDEYIDNRMNITINNIFDNAKYSTVSSNITTNKEAAEWKQYDQTWASINLGNTSSTIKSAGCLVTSIAIQIKSSGTSINMDNFNPGSFVEHLNENGGFSKDLFTWNYSSWSTIAPNWQFVSKVSLPKSKKDKIETVSNILNQGYYPVMCVKKNCGHWVAVTGVENDNIKMADPGSDSTTVFPKYSNIGTDESLKIAYFKKTD